jgi:outer membrane immunogenic protein
MNHLGKIVVTAAAGLACALTAASAADLPIKADRYQPPILSAYNWTGLGLEGFGLYGVNFGGASTHDDLGLGLNDDLSAHPHGPGVGGGFWYFYQPSPGGIVFGIRAEIAYANLQSGASSNLGIVPLSVSNATNFLGDVDACLGLSLSADGRLLGYGCGGFGFGGAKPNLQVASLQAAASDTSTGYNAALGLKYALTPNWIVGIEGDYFKLGDRQLTATIGGTPVVTSNTKYDIFVQKFTIGYKF